MGISGGHRLCPGLHQGREHPSLLTWSAWRLYLRPGGSQQLRGLGVDVATQPHSGEWAHADSRKAIPVAQRQQQHNISKSVSRQERQTHAPLTQEAAPCPSNGMGGTRARVAPWGSQTAESVGRGDSAGISSDTPSRGRHTMIGRACLREGFRRWMSEQDREIR